MFATYFLTLENSKIWFFSQRHETHGGPNTLTFLCLSQNLLSSCHSVASFFDVKFLSYCQFDKMTFFGVTFMVNILNAFRFLRMMVSSCWMFYFYKPIFGNSDSVEKVFIFWWRTKMKYILFLLFWYVVFWRKNWAICLLKSKIKVTATFSGPIQGSSCKFSLLNDVAFYGWNLNLLSKNTLNY